MILPSLDNYRILFLRFQETATLGQTLFLRCSLVSLWAELTTKGIRVGIKADHPICQQFLYQSLDRPNFHHQVLICSHSPLSTFTRALWLSLQVIFPSLIYELSSILFWKYSSSLVLRFLNRSSAWYQVSLLRILFHKVL